MKGGVILNMGPKKLRGGGPKYLQKTPQKPVCKHSLTSPPQLVLTSQPIMWVLTSQTAPVSTHLQTQKMGLVLGQIMRLQGLRMAHNGFVFLPLCYPMHSIIMA
jgi:hypothetical protein